MEEERPDRKRGMSAGGKAVLAICIVLAVLFILFFVQFQLCPKYIGLLLEYLA